MDSTQCTGHYGHIELSAPVYNPIMFKFIYKILRSKCFNCHKLKGKEKSIIYYYLKLCLIKLGFMPEAACLDSLLFSVLSPDSNLFSKISLIRYCSDVF